MEYFLSRKNVRIPWNKISNLTLTKLRAEASNIIKLLVFLFERANLRNYWYDTEKKATLFLSFKDHILFN